MSVQGRGTHHEPDGLRCREGFLETMLPELRPASLRGICLVKEEEEQHTQEPRQRRYTVCSQAVGTAVHVGRGKQGGKGTGQAWERIAILGLDFVLKGVGNIWQLLALL